MKATITAALAAVAVGLLGLVALARSGGDWSDSRAASCMPSACFCEAIRAGPIRQPANTTSGLAFLAVAAAVLVHGRTRRRERVRQASSNAFVSQSVYVELFATAVLIVGVGTAYYHASLSFGGQTADVFGMFLIATFLLSYNVARLVPVSARTAGASYVIGNAVLLWTLVALPDARRYIFAVLVLAVITLELVLRTRRGVSARSTYFHAALATLVIGVAVWILDLTRTMCAPHSMLQGHALWHLCGAAATWLIYLYYQSETA